MKDTQLEWVLFCTHVSITLIYAKLIWKNYVIYIDMGDEWRYETLK